MLDKIPQWTMQSNGFSSTILVQLSRKFRMPGTVVRMLKGGVDSSTESFYVQFKYCLSLPRVFLCDIRVVCLKLNLSVCTKLRAQGMGSVFICRYFERQKWVAGEMHEEHRM